ncbi:MAG: nucleotide exchange factor GrpE [bacterium]
MMTYQDDLHNENSDAPLEEEKIDVDIVSLQNEKDEYLKGWQRAKADFINYKREESERLERVAQFGNEELIRDLLQVLDSFDLSLAMLEKEGHVEKGVYMIKGQLEDVLRRKGLDRIRVSVGEAFNPHYHEAVVMIDGEGESGAVAEEVEAGYRLHGKVIRPSRVKIIK